MEYVNDKEFDYLQTHFYHDKSLELIRKTRKSLDEAIMSLNEQEKTRKKQLAFEWNLAYGKSGDVNDDLHDAFPDGREVCRKEIKGTCIVVMEDKDGNQFNHYFSPLGIIVKGMPKEKNGEFYCKITGEKISK